MASMNGSPKIGQPPFAAWITCDFVEQVNSSRLEFRHASNDSEQHGQKMGTGETASVLNIYIYLPGNDCNISYRCMEEEFIIFQ